MDWIFLAWKKRIADIIIARQISFIYSKTIEPFGS